MKFAWQTFLLAVTTLLFSWIFGFGGTAVKTFIFPAFTATTSVYLTEVILINLITAALGCWLAVFAVEKTGQLNFVNRPKKLAGAVTLIFVIINILPMIFSVMLGVDVPTFILVSVALSVVVIYFTLAFFLARYVVEPQS